MNRREKAALRQRKIALLVKRDIERCINYDDAFENMLEYGFKGYRNMTLKELDAELCLK